MSFFEQVDKTFHDWNYQHPKALYAFVRMLRPRSIVDCGSYRGLSASWMAKGCQENNIGRVICIDRWSLTEHSAILGSDTPKQHCEKNLIQLGVREWVEFHDGDSHDPKMWPDKVDFAYIDAWHSFDSARNDMEMAAERGATFIAFDDTENCIGPRMLTDHMRHALQMDWEVMHFHSDNGLTIFLKKAPRRLITFSQELPYPNPGVDLRPLSKAQQKAHFDEATAITGINYDGILNDIEHDTIL